MNSPTQYIIRRMPVPGQLHPTPRYRTKIGGWTSDFLRACIYPDHATALENNRQHDEVISLANMVGDNPSPSVPSV